MIGVDFLFIGLPEERELFGGLGAVLILLLGLSGEFVAVTEYDTRIGEFGPLLLGNAGGGGGG